MGENKEIDVKDLFGKHKRKLMPEVYRGVKNMQFTGKVKKTIAVIMTTAMLTGGAATLYQKKHAEDNVKLTNEQVKEMISNRLEQSIPQMFNQQEEEKLQALMFHIYEYKMLDKYIKSDEEKDKFCLAENALVNGSKDIETMYLQLIKKGIQTEHNTDINKKEIQAKNLRIRYMTTEGQEFIKVYDEESKTYLNSISSESKQAIKSVVDLQNVCNQTQDREKIAEQVTIATKSMLQYGNKIKEKETIQIADASKKQKGEER